MPTSADLIRVLESVHAQISERASQIEAQVPLRCQRGCSACCLDDLTVFQCEAEYIRLQCGDVLKEAPHAAGKCAFLNEAGECRIYKHRPYVCRTHGLPLRWINDENQENILEERDICELNQDVPLETLSPENCWTIGPVETHLSRIESLFYGKNAFQRISLRDLFH